MWLRSARALTLFEIIVAVAVFAIAVLALVSVRVFALRAQVKTEQNQQATVLAMSLMAEAEGRVRASFDQPLQPADYPLMTAEELPAGYSFEAQQNYETSDLQKVSVTVRWTDKTGPQEYVLWTKFSR